MIKGFVVQSSSYVVKTSATKFTSVRCHRICFKYLTTLVASDVIKHGNESQMINTVGWHYVVQLVQAP